MAASSKRIKVNKDGEKKQAKKVEEEIVRIEERKDEQTTEDDLASPSIEEQIVGSFASPQSAPEPVYEEPLLTQLIVSRFDSDSKIHPVLGVLKIKAVRSCPERLFTKQR